MKSIDEKIELLKNQIKELEAKKAECPTTIGGRIKKMLNIKGVTFDALAKKIGCTEPTVAHYVNDKRKISAEMLGTIAKFLNVSCDYLIFGEDSCTGIGGNGNETQ
ncbi:MAG: helix-turn-helix transcriptional regulator [Oscillospiraceae bacterium]|nr:helix-turn-helix transcriptional regulator [Oscillospiraceae bacterium]